MTKPKSLVQPSIAIGGFRSASFLPFRLTISAVLHTSIRQILRGTELEGEGGCRGGSRRRSTRFRSERAPGCETRPRCENVGNISAVIRGRAVSVPSAYSPDMRRRRRRRPRDPNSIPPSISPFVPSSIPGRTESRPFVFAETNESHLFEPLKEEPNHHHHRRRH